MNILDSARGDTVRQLYAAYVAQHPDVAAAMLTSDFTFSSPRDDHIDRASYFAHCWPKEKIFRAIHIEHLVSDGEDVIVCYRAEKMDGTSFRNVEMLHFTGDRIAAVDVYFGRNV